MSRIGVLFWRWALGGAEVVSYYIIKSIIDNGYAPYIFYISGDVNTASYEAIVGSRLPDNVRIRKIIFFDKFTLYKNLFVSRFINRFNLDVVVNASGGAIPYIPFNSNCVSYIHYITLLRRWERSVHGSGMNISRKLFNRLWNIYYSIYKTVSFNRIIRSINECNDAVVNSSITADVVKRYAGRGNLTIIHPPVPKYNEYVQLRSKNNRSNNLILVISRISPEKEIDRVIEISRYLDNDYDVVIAGSLNSSNYWYYRYIVNLIKRYGLENRVVLRTNIDEETKYRLLSEATVYLSTTKLEPFGISIGEAAVAGIPLVVSVNSGFYADICRSDGDGCYGWEDSDPGLIADLIKRASRDRPLPLERVKHLDPARFMESFWNVLDKWV